MSKVILYIAVSLDGYIALSDGSVSWLSEYEGGKEDYGYRKFYESAGAAIMGARTYEQALGFGEWSFKGLVSYVVTHGRRSERTQEDVIFYSGNLAKCVEEAKKKTKKNIWLVGGVES